MKKIILFIYIFLIPLNVFAYSDYVSIGGQNIGIDINNKGIIIIGFYKINGKYNQNKLKVGDVILKVNNIDVSSINDMIDKIEQNVIDNTIYFTIKRNNKVFNTEFNLVTDKSKYKTGLYVKDNISGIGTLSYIDPNTKIYGALGHEIIEGNTGKLIEVKSGSIFESSITSIDKSVRGTAGSKNAKFYSYNKYGNIIKNTPKGIYGIYDKDIDNNNILKVAQKEEISLGKAFIKTVIDKEEIKEFEINIDKISYGENKNIHFEIISQELLNKTGGIVQGMSGSPIIQDNKIIGAVTHVIVDNPTTGYGIFITKMLEEGDKIYNLKIED